MNFVVQDMSTQITKDGWNSTMSILGNLDLVITIDSAVAHLAGAMGVPVWNILNYASYWPFGRTGNTTTDWYPSMTLIRQTSHGDWSSAILQVKENLKKLKSKIVVI
jgi:hypothetical protein